MIASADISKRQMEIMEAAGLIMTNAGFGGLTTKSLAKTMNFSESAIYRHFRSKEEIVVSLLDYLAQNMGERLEMAIGDANSSEEAFTNLFQN